MKFILLFAITLVVFANCSNSKSEISKPNVLFIVVDDLGYYDLGFTGSELYETPNIDKLAEKSMQFTQGYSTSAVCSPSRASLLSGNYTATHGVTDWIGAKYGEDWRNAKRFSKLLPANYEHRLKDEYTTLPEAFLANGYQTFFAGKWHLGDEESSPEKHGFQINKGGFHAGSPSNGRFFAPFNNPALTDNPDEKGMNLSWRLASETAQFIKENTDKPFLAYLSFYAVHAPIQTTKEKWTKYRNKLDSMNVAEIGFEMEREMPIRRFQDNPVYAGLIEHVDDAVGLVLTTLEEQGLDKNTIVIFTSDNGGVASGDNFSTSNSPLRGGKGYQWEGGVRVPYLIYVPSMDTKYSSNNTPVTGADFYPTLLDLAGITSNLAQTIDGISLLPILKGEKIEQRAIYWHYPHYGNQGGEPNSIIRDGNWKLIHYWEDQRNELYNLEIDQSEQNDMAAMQPDIAAKLQSKLMLWLKGNGALYPIADPIYTEEAHQMKRADFQNVLMPKLEEGRKKMLQPGWEPSHDWWGSIE